VTWLVVAIFVLAYAGLALGRVPGLPGGRAGIAALAALALLAAGAASPREAVVHAANLPTLALLFAMMLVSARFAASGAYDHLAARIAAGAGSPVRLLVVTVAVAGGLSAVLLNDIVVFVMTPLLVRGLAARGLDPRPFLAGLAGAANAGSAATLIGNPQNIVIGEVGGLDFLEFFLACAPPALVALAIVALTVRLVWREALAARPGAPVAPPAAIDRVQATRAAAASLLIVCLFLGPVPRDMVAGCAVAVALLASGRFALRDIRTGIDWSLLVLFTGLFVINHALTATGVTREALAWLAANGAAIDTLATMLPFALVASNTIGNVPAVVLLLAAERDWGPGVLQALALTTTLAGNFFLVGSIANLIVAERAAASGVRFGFAAHARAGVPMTLATLVVAAAWLSLTGRIGW
jgi:Na+/H+ antiporter NhaD/arsenite permease-like protein